MKNILTCLILFSALPVSQVSELKQSSKIPALPSKNLFVITIDGFRWQELFTGADVSLINNVSYTPDTSTIKIMYWSENEKERRQQLMPFFWNVIARKGQLYGNRNFDNKVNTANVYRYSYPGYNEIFTGHTDIRVSTNKKKNNGNLNVLEYLNSKEEYKGKVVCFTSWDVFPYILNEERSGMLINSGYENMEEATTASQQMINQVQTEGVYAKGATRHDALTFLTAKEYVQHHKPKVIYISLGETDEYAHQGRYDLYLQQANAIDRQIADLWHWVQTSPDYKDNTTFLITTDHGRGSRDEKWTSHGAFIQGSSQTWLALLGPGIEPLGELKAEQQFYQRQLASTIAALVGEEFVSRK